MLKNYVIIILLCISLPLQADPVVNAYGLTINKNIYGAKDISDVLRIPQDSGAFTSKFTNDSKDSFVEYFELFFAPWNDNKRLDSNVLQGELNKRKEHFAGNYQRISNNFYDYLEKNANVAAINSVLQKAILVNNTCVRILPSNTLFFDNPAEAGNGYPFDMIQDDYLGIGEPILISHYTKDGKYAYVLDSTGSYGFVLSQDLVEVDDQFIKAYKQNLVMITSNTLIKLERRSSPGPTMQLYIGSVLPLVNAQTLNIPIRNAQGKPELKAVLLQDQEYISKPLSFSKANVSKVVNSLIGQPYGWGGINFYMDCARLVRNYFAVFGVHMPLWSYDQGKQGKILNIAELSNEQKKAAILKYGIPYQSIIQLPGHIGIYIGEFSGEPIMFHSPWGVKLYDVNGTGYRYIIGKSIISTLSPGQELIGYNAQRSNYLDKIEVISNLVY